MTVETNRPILVAGATGGVGQHVARQLLKQGRAVRLLVRDARRAQKLFGQNVELVVGDVRQPGTLTPALKGMRAVVCAVGSRSPAGNNSPRHVDYEGIHNLVQAATAAKVEHFVLVSSIAVTQPDHPLNSFGQVLKWKSKSEEALRASGLSYTIVRPGALIDEPGGQKALKFDQGDRTTGRIGRADVARVCIAALEEPQARNVTLEVVQAEGPPPTDWASLFAALAPDE